MIDIIGMAAVSAIPAVVDYMVLKDHGEKIRKAKLKEFYMTLSKDRTNAFYK